MPRLSCMKCYFGCVTKGPFHQFPKPKYPDLERFNLWKMVLSESVKQKDDIYIHNNIRLCDCHFEWYYRSASKRLTRNAVPTLNISTSSQSTVFPAINDIVESKNVLQDLQLETKSTAGSTNQQIEVGICGSPTKINKDLNETAVPAQIQRHTCTESRLLNLKVQKLKAKCKALQQQVRQARKQSLHKAFLKGVKALPEAAQIFTNMQLSKTLKKSQGRRFTKQEKILSLTIYKQSEKTYEFLQKLFTLPSKRTLQKMLSEEKKIDRNGGSLMANGSHTHSDLLAQACTGIL